MNFKAYRKLVTKKSAEAQENENDDEDSDSDMDDFFGANKSAKSNKSKNMEGILVEILRNFFSFDFELSSPKSTDQVIRNCLI